MEQKKKINKKSLIFGLGLIVLICFIGVYRSNTVEKEGVYTIATIYNIKKTRGGRGFDYMYIYKGRKYQAHGVAPYVYTKDEGVRFFIQILPNDPERRWFHDIRVPDSITEAPHEGWKELPIQVQE